MIVKDLFYRILFFKIVSDFIPDVCFKSYRLKLLFKAQGFLSPGNFILQMEFSHAQSTTAQGESLQFP